MSESLFDLVGEYKQLYELLTDGEQDEQIIEDSLESVTGALEAKASGYVAIMDRLDMEIAACEKHKAEWDARLKARKNGKDRLKKRLIEGMTMLGVDELKAGDVTISLKNAGGVLPIVYDESKNVPEKFTKVTIETDGKLVREALNRGEQLDFAHFGERSKTIKIK